MIRRILMHIFIWLGKQLFDTMYTLDGEENIPVEYMSSLMFGLEEEEEDEMPWVGVGNAWDDDGEL